MTKEKVQQILQQIGAPTVKITAYQPDSPFRVASITRKTLRAWQPSMNSPTNEPSTGDRLTLINRSRDAYHNQPLARAAIDGMIRNIVGPGLKLKSQIDFETLGTTQEAAGILENSIERAFRAWADSPECDIERSKNFAALQSLALRSVLLSGDIFASTPYLMRPENQYGLKIQLIEGERVRNPMDKTPYDGVYDGILSDKTGAPAYYYILKHHPNDTYNQREEYDVLPVFGKNTSRRRVLHVYQAIRPGQLRGIPYLSPVIETLKILDRYTSAELTAAEIASLFTVFIKSPQPENVLPVGTDDIQPSTDSNEIQLGKGSIVELAPGEAIEQAAPTRPSAGYEPFITAVVKQIGAALGVPYEELMLFYSSSYSAARAAMLQAYKNYITIREWFAAMFCQPIYELWFDEAVANGMIQAPGYDDPQIRAAYVRASWIGPARGAIDELKEAEAADKRIQIGISTIAEEAAAMGGEDWDIIHRQRALEHKMRVAEGLEPAELNQKTQGGTNQPPQGNQGATNV